MCRTATLSKLSHFPSTIGAQLNSITITHFHGLRDDRNVHMNIQEYSKPSRRRTSIFFSLTVAFYFHCNSQSIELTIQSVRDISFIRVRNSQEKDTDFIPVPLAKHLILFRFYNHRDRERFIRDRISLDDDRRDTWLV